MENLGQNVLMLRDPVPTFLSWCEADEGVRGLGLDLALWASLTLGNPGVRSNVAAT